jgi:hypothetical protein
MFQRAMGAIFEMILAESGRSSAAEQNEVSARIDKTIAALSPTEFPNLTEFPRGPCRRGRTGASGKAVTRGRCTLRRPTGSSQRSASNSGPAALEPRSGERRRGVIALNRPPHYSVLL